MVEPSRLAEPVDSTKYQDIPIMVIPWPKPENKLERNSLRKLRMRKISFTLVTPFSLIGQMSSPITNIKEPDYSRGSPFINNQAPGSSESSFMKSYTINRITFFLSQQDGEQALLIQDTQIFPPGSNIIRVPFGHDPYDLRRVR